MLLFTRITEFLNREEGHATTLPGLLLGGAGAILLAVGAANDTGWLAIVGGVVLAVGFVATDVLNHTQIAYGIFARLDELEKK